MQKILFLSLVACYSATVVSADKESRRDFWKWRQENFERHKNDRTWRTNFPGGKSRKIDCNTYDVQGGVVKNMADLKEELYASVRKVAPHRTIKVVPTKIKQVKID